MAEAVVSTTVQILGDLLIQEGKFLYGVRDQIRELQAELERMQCFLKDADKRRDESQSVRSWVRSIRNLAYKIENVLETYAIKVQFRKDKGIKKALKRFACILDEGANIHKIGLEIGKIKTELESLRRSLEIYVINREKEGESSNAANKDWLRQTFPHEIEENFVGMQNDIDTLVSLVVHRAEDHRIISIYGMGGSGKTTLAKKIFNHRDVQNHFASFAWVTVSQQFVANSLLQEILRQLDRERERNRDDIKNMECRELLEELCKVQKEKNCLVVLDDIWKTDDWNILKHALLDAKVVLTTRIQRVAEIGIAHKLDLLTEEEGWQLLQKKAALTRANDGDAYVQEKLGKEMVRKCGYLPLAISVIGGMLREKRTLEGWEMVNRNMNSYMMCGGGTQENPEVMQVLTLSFDDLPYQLKPCFLYFACYPEDAEIDVDELLQIWIAEGMVLSQDKFENETLTEVAQRYLSDMVNRSLIQVKLDETAWTSDQYKYCRLHDLIHDLCLRKCKEEDFLEVMDFRGGKKSIADLRSIKGNSCRLTFYLGDHEIEDDQILQEANKLTRFYSVKYFGPKKDFKISKNLGNLRLLNVISFESLKFGNPPRLLHKVIKKLIHLRSLSFIKCTLDEVPSSVAMLPYLQTFYFKGYYDVVKMPNALWKSKRLTHFIIRGAYAQGKLRLDYCTGLETLIMYGKELEVYALPQLTNLRVFHAEVNDTETLSVILNCIKDNWLKISEVYLTICDQCLIGTEDRSILLQFFMCPKFSILDIVTRFGKLPKYESGMLNNLVKLKLALSFIVEDPMPTLERLPKLKKLLLGWKSFMGEELFCSSIGFRHLTHLELWSLPGLWKWRIDEGAMPNLSYVSIGRCWKLEMIPDGMKFLKALRKFETSYMPKKFNNRIRIIDSHEGADFHKVRHVPQIIIKKEL